jgi:hypothetical protein
MATIAVTTNSNQQTTEQALIAADSTGITFGTLGDANNPIVFGTATARNIDARNPAVIRIAPLDPMRMWYTLHFANELDHPSYSRYHWTDAFGDPPTRVVFRLDDVVEVK